MKAAREKVAAGPLYKTPTEYLVRAATSPVLDAGTALSVLRTTDPMPRAPSNPSYP